MRCVAETSTSTDSSAGRRIALFAVVACLLAYAGALAWLSRRTVASQLEFQSAANWLVVFSIPAGLIYLGGAWLIMRNPSTKMMVAAIILTGLAMRAIVMTSPPSIEDDFYRYLWDGAVTARGLNPYEYSPTQILWGSIGAEPIPQPLRQLADESGSILEHVNHPHLTTIYPPIAQLAFATAHMIAPWSTDSWRVLLLLAEGVTLVILFRLLSVLGLSSTAIVWYWWNPILLREIYGGAHMDVLLLPFIVGAVVLATKKRFSVSMLLLALAGGVKLWPIILAPILLGSLLATPKRLFLPLTVFLGTTALVWLPTLPHALSADSGFIAYAEAWQNNAGVFTLLERSGRYILAGIGEPYVYLGQPIARGIVGVTLLAWIAWLSLKPVIAIRDVPRRCCLAVAALFLLAPAQFPWYYVWLLPFLSVVPSIPLLSYSFLLPLYYVRAVVPTVVWLEHGVVWLLLAREMTSSVIRQRRFRRIESVSYADSGC